MKYPIDYEKTKKYINIPKNKDKLQLLRVQMEELIEICIECEKNEK